MPLVAGSEAEPEEQGEGGASERQGVAPALQAAPPQLPPPSGILTESESEWMSASEGGDELMDAQEAEASPEMGPGGGEAGEASITSLSLGSGAVLPPPHAPEHPASPASGAKRHKASDASGASPRSATPFLSNAAAAAAAAEPVTHVQGQCAVCQQSATEKAPLNWVVGSKP